MKLLQNLKVRLHNLWNWRTVWAVRYLSKQLQRDKAFRDSWHANIAMPIYDAVNADCVEPIMSNAQASAIADRLMKHLFDA